MDEIEIRVTWKGKKAKMVLRQEDNGINGYIAGKTRVLTLEVDDSEDEVSTTETFHHDDLECDSDEVSEAVLDALEEEEEEDEDDEEDEEDDEEDEDEEGEEDEEEEASLSILKMIFLTRFALRRTQLNNYGYDSVFSAKNFL